MMSCVSLISLVRLSWGKLRTRSSWGFTWMTRMPNKVLSSCRDRNAFANSCCSGESEWMASLNSFGVGMVDNSSGMLSSSLFCTSMACLGSKVSAEVMRPTRTSMQLNCRARATSESFAPIWSENLCDNQAWRYRSPPNATRAEALRLKCMGRSEVPRPTKVVMGAAMLESPPGPTTSSSMLTVPSGVWWSERRTAKQNGTGAYAWPKTLRPWNCMYCAKSAGDTSLPMAAMSWLLNMPSM
mmetsp:Transcript_60474/g.169489  ORF Transcript_60474/g.169489 Transcript_60474/m.169489 type:complete len:241 (-) Transcript_60474:416-1138(-)